MQSQLIRDICKAQKETQLQKRKRCCANKSIRRDGRRSKDAVLLAMKVGEAAKSPGIQMAARIRKKAKRLSSYWDQPCGQLAFSPGTLILDFELQNCKAACHTW